MNGKESGVRKSIGDRLPDLPSRGRRLFARVKRHRVVVALVLVGALVAGGLFLGRKSIARWMEPRSIADLRTQAKDDPKSYDRWLDLGHAQFQAKHPAEGIKAYDRALSIDAEAGKDQHLRANLSSCFGTKEQNAAAALIVHRQLRAMEPNLEQLARSHDYHVRWGALTTLEKLDLASKGEFVAAWTKDLEESDCEVRRRAVDKLGAQGDMHAITALRVAKHKDQASTPWYKRSCLGSRPDDAEKQILARGEHHPDAHKPAVAKN